MRSPLHLPSTAGRRRALGAAVLAAGLIVGGAALPASGASAMTTVPAFAGATASAGTFYVDCSAKTAGDGSAASPWNSLAAVDAHGAFIPAQQILLRRGTTCTGRLSPAGSGAPGAPIVIGAYGKGAKPTVAGAGTYNNTGAVQLVNQSWWTVQDLHITNKTKSSTTSTYRSGLLLISNNGGILAGLTAQRLSIDSVTSNPGNGNTRAYGGISALTFGTTVKSGFSGLVIANNSVSGVSRTGIVESNAQYPKSADTNSRITGNQVKHVRGDGIVLIGAKSSRIDHNVVAYAADLGSCAHCGRYGGPSTASAGIWPSNVQNVLMDYNEVYGTHNDGGDGEGFDIDRGSVGVTMQYNYSHDNEGGGVLLCGAKNSVIRFNIFQNNHQSALSFYGKAPSTNTAFSNNTVYAKASSKAKVVRTFAGIHGGSVSFTNNLIYSYGPGQYQWPSKHISTAANTLIGTSGSAHPNDRRTSWRNPGLKAAGTGRTGFGSLKGYKPAHPSSFARGVAISKSVKTDIFGKRINAAKPPRGAAG